MGERTYWHRVLTTGGATTLPRWARRDAGEAVGGHECELPAELAAAVRLLAEQMAVPPSAVLLAAHVKVLAALSGEAEVVTGYAAVPAGSVLPCPLTAAGPSWRELVRAAHRVESELLAHAGFPVEELRAELAVAGPEFETVFDPAGEDGQLGRNVVLRIGIAERDSTLLLRLRFRTEALHRAAAARIAGYHKAALALLTADPDAEHGRQSLLSAGERRFQLDGLAGARRELPDLRVHELFERRVREHPDAVAAVHGALRWTYAELDARANRLARALLARGLRREGVVAVVTERDLNWLAAVLAIFKAGGVYLPIEPRFPADRIATTLSRAGCELAVTEPGSTASLEGALKALPDVRVLSVDEAWREDHADTELGIPVDAGQLAYIYFTSGSTGEPKGAMCEHAGMLNHILAKLDDLDVGSGDVVAQTAPQCFDISLWQLLAALVVGGRTVLVPQDVVLDVERFLDTITAAGVSVLQVVPSYLEVVLSALERGPRALPALRCVSVTGETVKAELVQRWFAARPRTRLVNAYGLTETSDDTNHEVMVRPPDSGRVPLGRPVANVRVYVVDEHLQPVPLGAPGEIVFSGVCVGRGYVNDPERTRAAFVADPHRVGERLYRSGDHGRWRPDGKLEFLGRRDSQVKIRGFRIEIGEIENVLLRVPGVRDAAVVVAERGGKRLVAFYAGPRPLTDDALRAALSATLPEYMVPSEFHCWETLPLTANSKIDRKALTALAQDLGDGDDSARDVPATPAEHRVAAAWAEVLGVPREAVGRRDHFFDRGGTSLSAVRLVVALDRAVSLAEVTRSPVLADLAALIHARAADTQGFALSGVDEPVFSE